MCYKIQHKQEREFSIKIHNVFLTCKFNITIKTIKLKQIDLLII